MFKLSRPREFGAGVFILTVIFTVISTFSLLRFRSQTASQHLRREILELSEKYVLALIQEESDGTPGSSVGGGPHSGGQFTQHDLSRTIAVVLEDVLTRLEHLEHVVRNKTNCSQRPDVVNDPVTNKIDSDHPSR
ncbi:coiled-coil domain-containing protein 126-like [Liolophura sinensis]|uniref:coiled-coil domain-containing protein 126-like n=1 Tax=Liolophura sinensis TaxID=3198878 RepID=UPI0031597363